MRATIAGWLLVLACAAVVTCRAVTVPAPRGGRAATPAESAALAAEAARREPEWRRAAARDYPGDLWSADDDFHAREKSWARGAAKRLGVRLGDVLLALDRGLRADAAASGTPSTSRALRPCGVPPCKPRPFYD